MTINDLLQTLEKKNPECAFPPEGLSSECGFYEYISEFYEDGNPLKHWLHQDASWLCTDTHVGIGFLFFGEEFVAVTSQSARKNPICYEWKDKESFAKVREWILSKTIEPEFKIVDLNEDVANWFKR